MKLFLTLLLLTLGAALTHAQTTTNLSYRIIVETVSGGVTNTASTTNFRYDYGANTKDGLKIEGLTRAYSVYTSSGGTNSFGLWLKQDVADRAVAYQNAKIAQDNATLLTKLQSLLLSNLDLLSASDITSLNTIAAKAP